MVVEKDEIKSNVTATYNEKFYAKTNAAKKLKKKKKKGKPVLTKQDIEGEMKIIMYCK